MTCDPLDRFDLEQPVDRPVDELREPLAGHHGAHAHPLVAGDVDRVADDRLIAVLGVAEVVTHRVAKLVAEPHWPLVVSTECVEVSEQLMQSGHAPIVVVDPLALGGVRVEPEVGGRDQVLLDGRAADEQRETRDGGVVGHDLILRGEAVPSSVGRPLDRRPESRWHKVANKCNLKVARQCARLTPWLITATSSSSITTLAHGLRAGAVIAVPGGRCAERRPHVATQQEPRQRALAVVPGAQVFQLPVSDGRFRRFVDDLIAVDEKLDEIRASLKLAEHRGVVEVDGWDRLKIGDLSLRLSLILGELEEISSFAEVDESLSIDLGELDESLAKTLPLFTRISDQLAAAQGGA